MFNEHLERLDFALKRLKNDNLKLKPSKFSFRQGSVSFLGHIISDKEISIDHVKLDRIQDWPQRRNQVKMRSIFWFATYYRKFIKGFVHIAAPLNFLLQQDNAYKWSPDCKAAFEALQKDFSEIVTLAHLDFKTMFTVDTDASDYGIGGDFSQMNEHNREQPVADFSRTFSKFEQIRSDA